jgi:hypothetical protein
MDSWLSQDLATQLVRERIAETAAQLRADAVVRQAHAAVREGRAAMREGRATAAPPRTALVTPHTGPRDMIAGSLRRLAVRLDPSLGTTGR